METQTYITCDGQIGNNGMCDKCGQPTMTTGNSCGKLIPVSVKQQTPLQKLKTKLQTLLRAEGLRDAHLGIETSLKYLNDLLPEEKQMVIDATYASKETTGEQYFNETFES